MAVFDSEKQEKIQMQQSWNKVKTLWWAAWALYDWERYIVTKLLLTNCDCMFGLGYSRHFIGYIMVMENRQGAEKFFIYYRYRI